MKLIVGLGNPGEEYRNSRHNVGFMVIDRLADSLGVSINKRKDGALMTQLIINDEKVILLKPQRYINLSGEVILQIKDYYKVSIDDIIVICDDLDLPLGKYKLKSQGSSGGHNGLKNIELHLETTAYKRLKIGISNNKDIDTKDYVLDNFSKEEKPIIDEMIVKAVTIIMDSIKVDFMELMNKYNGL